MSATQSGFTANASFPRIDTPSILQPPRQRRARETEQALLGAGRELLASRDFAAVSVAQIAAACQVSVGAFYGRFRDKMAYFEALRALVMEETAASTERYLAQERWEDVPTPVLLEKATRFMVLGTLANRGVIRASLRHASTRPEEWVPHRQSGEAIVERMVQLLVPRLAMPADTAEVRVRFAMQAVFSVLVNAVLNDSGPLHLDDEQMIPELNRLMAGYLGVPCAEPA
ncbi:DNA-binding protein, AcrR family, includes nucleoid occlusion protein SlmA [Cupriavidus necator]|uniref:TetR/AcrR family transcriptional regulator n=1 Tax=Cupriavidus necator (strain ATCC 17699 / DSM 428 / KCTC 22496 / NCIMB 10442 / H16 / Stanier 337) TaxID=381666 RepID=Q0K366_CUPNH|nr:MULTISPECIES: TetR/AcrR family transcriptional regulator [Cupriavidus]EON19044.1 TetR/AcrR family transcriptional regulator [Cupriavidus sp. GA3-3]KUE87546.1 TetR family transcriptional regulator [Cupriavidus necator]QCC03457.1 TetR/AcrR family transcriptional regulator [Cupriavidus necator H16]QQB80513.1 TetR/AcrR family transcriptional regulator [Cupriavidus necator]WKA44795.1 TetR/AcrR family transcriptional regulator [Cupriavidus necator]